jgi:hypothetical protein
MSNDRFAAGQPVVRTRQHLDQVVLDICQDVRSSRWRARRATGRCSLRFTLARHMTGQADQRRLGRGGRPPRSLAGKVQERYGLAKDEAEKRLVQRERKATDDWLGRDKASS